MRLRTVLVFLLLCTSCGGRMPEGGGLSSTERQRILDDLACDTP